jgi:hypothetical protein
LQQPSKKLLRDDPRGLRNGLFLWWFSFFDALPVTSALRVPLLFARPCDPVLLLGLPLRPCTRRLAAVIAAIPLPSVSWAKPLFASLQQAPAGPRPAGRPMASATRLLFGRACKILGKAHGRVITPRSSAPGGEATPLRGPANLRLMATSRIYLKRPAAGGILDVLSLGQHATHTICSWLE